jgi:hypothetical protein
MKTLVAAVLIVLAAGSTAFAHPWVAVPVAPAPVVVQAYYPPTPVYAYPSAVVAVPGRYMVAAPIVMPQPVMVPAPVYARPVVVRPKVYVLGEPVRNVLRAITP